MPTPPNSSFQTISQQEFDLYSAFWQVAVNLNDGASLRGCFSNEQGPIKYLGYSAEQITLLVSTVGAHRIEARFISIPVEDSNPLEDSDFALVLYATNKLGSRISSYYLATRTAIDSAPSNADLTPTNSTGSSQSAVQIPHYMAASWINNWAAIWADGAAGPQRSMFINQYGTLQGYSFSVGDVAQSLFNAQKQDVDYYMLFNFGLHEFKHGSVDDPDQSVYTFGLIIRLYNQDGAPTAKRTNKSLRAKATYATLTKSAQPGADESDQEANDAPANDQSNEPFYDMSTPRPPFRVDGD